MPIIVAVCGKRGHGKSTLADYLVKTHQFTELTLAGPLKRACQEIFGFTDMQVHDARCKEQVDSFWKVTPREVLQKVGTELFRDQLPKLFPTMSQIWIQSLMRQLSALPDGARVVITDVRFPDEFRALHNLGALMVRVVRPDYVPKGDACSSALAAAAQHPSETALDDVRLFTPDVLLMNDSTVDHLVETAERLLPCRFQKVVVLCK